MPTKKKQKVNPDSACQFPDNPSCPYHSGSNSPYRYQLGCRGEACKTANREYYRSWRNSKSNGKVPVKKAKSIKPVKKVAKKATKRK